MLRKYALIYFGVYQIYLVSEMARKRKKKPKCKYGALKTPYTDSKGVKHVCRKKKK